MLAAGVAGGMAIALATMSTLVDRSNVAASSAPVATAASAPARRPPVATPALTNVDAETSDDAADDEAAVPEPADEESIEDLVGRVIPAVAFIEAGRSRGTGFFITADRVMTNAHVVGNETMVRLKVGAATYAARVGAVSKGADLAVLHVANASAMQPALRLGSIDEVRVGQEVIAVGSPLGLTNTVTRGIVSAIRDVGDVRLVQTDAAINPGHSGGPLVDRQGRVIAINSMTVKPSAGQGLAFAVAADHVTQLLNGRAPAGAPLISSLDPTVSTPRSAADDQRVAGEQDYVQALQAIARGAEQIDTFWDRYAPTCLAGLSAAGGRPWFAALTRDGVRLSTSAQIDCEGWLAQVRTGAQRVDMAIQRANEAARRHGVFPGTLRDVRRQQRLDWAGWDK